MRSELDSFSSLWLLVNRSSMMKGNQHCNTLWTMDTIKSMRNNGFVEITQRSEGFVVNLEYWGGVDWVRCQVRSVMIIPNANLFKSQSENLNNGSKMFRLRNNKGDDEHLCPLQTLKSHFSLSLVICRLDIHFSRFAKPKGCEIISLIASTMLSKNSISKQRKVDNWKWTVRKLIRNDLHFHLNTAPFEFNVSKWNSRVSSPRGLSLCRLSSFETIKSVGETHAARIDDS